MLINLYYIVDNTGDSRNIHTCTCKEESIKPDFAKQEFCCEGVGHVIFNLRSGVGQSIFELRGRGGSLAL